MLNPDDSIERVVWYSGLERPGWDYYVTGYNSDGWLSGNTRLPGEVIAPVL